MPQCVSTLELNASLLKLVHFLEPVRSKRLCNNNIGLCIQFDTSGVKFSTSFPAKLGHASVFLQCEAFDTYSIDHDFSPSCVFVAFDSFYRFLKVASNSGCTLLSIKLLENSDCLELTAPLSDGDLDSNISARIPLIDEKGHDIALDCYGPEMDSLALKIMADSDYFTEFFKHVDKSVQILQFECDQSANILKLLFQSADCAINVSIF